MRFPLSTGRDGPSTCLARAVGELWHVTNATNQVAHAHILPSQAADSSPVVVVDQGQPDGGKGLSQAPPFTDYPFLVWGPFNPCQAMSCQRP